MSAESRPRIVDFSTHLSGPLASHLLVEMGADVVKIEAPVLGDRNRGLNPQINGRGMFHVALNSGARSLAVSTRSPHWPEVVAAAAKWADAVIVGSRPADAAKRGLDFASLTAHNSSLTYCLISGFGEAGPWKDYFAHGQNIDALAGVLDASWHDGMPSTSPGWRSSGTSLAGVFGAMAILAGLNRASRYGRAQHVSVSQWASALWWKWRDLTCIANLEEPWRDYQELGTRYTMYPTSDGRALLVAPIEQKFWTRFCEIAGLPEGWLTVGSWERTGVDFGRGPEYGHERAVIAETMRGRTLDEWWHLLAAGEIPFAPVLTLEESLSSEHAVAERMFSTTTVQGSTARVVNSPIRFDDAAMDSIGPPPELGEHTESILAEFGLPAGLRGSLG